MVGTSESDDRTRCAVYLYERDGAILVEGSNTNSESRYLGNAEQYSASRASMAATILVRLHIPVQQLSESLQLTISRRREEGCQKLGCLSRHAVPEMLDIPGSCSTSRRLTRSRRRNPRT